MLDEEDLRDPSTRALDELFEALDTLSIAEARAVAAVHWDRCRHASLALALAERLAPRAALIAAAVACARDALSARSTPEPVLERALAIAAACARGEASAQDARRAARDAYGTVSRMVAGVDDDVGLAVMEACELAAGDAVDLGGTDPAFRAAWAHAWRQCGDDADRADVERADREHQARLAAIVRVAIPTLGGSAP